MNFAYDRVVDGKGVNRPFKDMRPFLKSRGIDSDYIKSLYNPVIELHYWCDNPNIITLDEALKSDEPFVYSLRYQGFPYTPKEWQQCNRFEAFPTKLVECINSGLV